jgi:hypothetical protein
VASEADRQREFVRIGRELLGHAHSDAAKKRWQAFYNALSKEEKKLYRKGGGDFPRKRVQ